MGLHYVIDLSCVPKRRFGADGLWERLRRLERFQRPEGMTPPEATEAVEAGFELRPLAFHCNRCPANHLHRDFGCYGTISFPISGEAEDWLIGLLPNNLQSRDTPLAQVGRQSLYVRQLLKRLRDLKVTGETAEDARSYEDVLERQRYSARRYGWLLDRVEVTSSQLLDLLLFRRKVDPDVAEVVCRALGVWADGGQGEDGVQEMEFTQPPSEKDDPTVAELKHFFYALMLACSVDVPVRTHVASPTAADQ